jgi:hypothetical protein
MHYQWRQNLDISEIQHARSRYSEILRELLEYFGEHPRENCALIIGKLKNSILASLQTSMQLTKGKQFRVAVTDYIPAEVRSIIDDIPEILVWLIALNPHIKNAHSLLKHVSKSSHEIQEYLNITIDNDAGERTIDDLRSLIQESESQIREIVQALLNSNIDKLGSYNPLNRQIEICWIPIFFVSRALSIPFEKLTYVVLIHELAHYLSHAGKDADGRTWETDQFCQSDIFIVEGIAQFWTCELSAKESTRLGIISTHTSRECFDLLLEHQRQPYQCFLNWLPKHPRRIESVRAALLVVREHGGDYEHFQHQLEKFGSNYI